MKKLLFFLFVSTFGYSQVLYQGNLIDEMGMPIPGATILVKGTNISASSDFDGNYSIQVKIGDELQISYMGMKTKTIKINSLILQKNQQKTNKITSTSNEKVHQILSYDYSEKLKEPEDSITISELSGTFNVNSLYDLEYKGIKKINKNENGFYSFQNNYQYHKLSFELSQEYVFSTPMRLPKYQKKYAQGRNLSGELVYQSPETNEIFSWGPNVNSLEYSANTTEFYPKGNIVNKSFGNGNLVQLYNPNDFYQNATDNKWSFLTQIESPKGNFAKINFTYKTGTISIPTSRNNEITTSLKYFRNLSQYSKIETLFSYNDFENNLSNANFGVNKIVYANAVTPIHFDNSIASTLSNGLQRSYSAFENNPYYLIHSNLDENKSKTISFNFNHKYERNRKTNTVNTSFQSSEIRNTNGQNFYFAGIVEPNFNERIEKFKSFSFSDVFKYNKNHDYHKFIESKIDFRFQERRLERNYFNGFASPADFPGNSLSQTKLDFLQERLEVFYNLNGSYFFSNIFSSYENLIVKASSTTNYSSTGKGGFLSNFLVSAKLDRLFRENFSFTITHNFNQVEPSLQNNNLNFNSLQYKVSQFKQLQNNLELITQKGSVSTNESVTNLGLTYDLDSRWSFNLYYYYKNVENLYAPVFDLNTVNWSPEVNYKQNGVEFVMRKSFYSDSNFEYNFNLNFTYYKNEVIGLNNNHSRIPFAGFSDVNKNYIVGQPLGVIVGNGYLRDENQKIIIDDSGFPIEDSQPKILGDPNPDFVVGFYNSFQYKKFSLNFSFDWSQGGKIWNGTQQTLNYYGNSELTENDRNITNYVFKGVTQLGLENTQSVTFYDVNLPVEQNRWTRYGIDGVAEDAIEDATYFRLNSINLSYNSGFDYFREKLFFTVSFFMNNVFIVSKSKSAFSNNSMFNSIETTGLDYFNAPMMRSFGTSLTLKF
ncbi:MAG: carboxypeptidase-like regulatory domain-containing protein [Bacteroidota bacterium]